MIIILMVLLSCVFGSASGYLDYFQLVLPCTKEQIQFGTLIKRETIAEGIERSTYMYRNGDYMRSCYTFNYAAVPTANVVTKPYAALTPTTTPLPATAMPITVVPTTSVSKTSSTTTPTKTNLPRRSKPADQMKLTKIPIIWIDS